MWCDDPEAPLPEGHNWIADEEGYQFRCHACGLVLFKKKFELGGGWGISCETENKLEPETPRPHFFTWYLPRCSR